MNDTCTRFGSDVAVIKNLEATFFSEVFKVREERFVFAAFKVRTFEFVDNSQSIFLLVFFQACFREVEMNVSFFVKNFDVVDVATYTKTEV